MSERISVTEVRNALRCPRIFALGRLRRRAVAFPVGSSCLGSTFHRVVDRFASGVSAPPGYFAALPGGAPRDDVEASLGRWLLEGLVEELSSDPTYAAIPGEVDDLAEALRELARHLAGRLAALALHPAEALREVVRAGERSFESALGPDGPVVHGRIDALYADSRGQLEVVEYKLTDEANEELDRAQVALYRELVRRAEGVEARPVILRFAPTLRETAMAPADSDALLERTVIPVVVQAATWAASPETAPPTSRRDICAACPLAQDCAETYPERLASRDDPPSAGPRPRPTAEGPINEGAAVVRPLATTDDEDGRRDAEAIKTRILAELKKEGVAAVAPKPALVGPTLFIIEIARRRGPVSHLDRAADDVQHRLASEDDLVVTYEKQGGHRHFVVKRPKPRRVYLGPLLEQRHEWLQAKAGRFVLGQRPGGEILTGDFSDASTPHLLVAGQSGSGKSVLLQSLVASLVQYHGPAAIRFTLVDPKRVTFIGPTFKAAVGAHLDGPIRYVAEETLPVIGQLVDNMEERYRLFEKAQVSGVDEYNEQVEPAARLERRLLVVDEFQDLVAEKDVAQEFFAGIKRLGAKARAAGIHMVLATQRPDRATVPPIVRANLTGKVALQVSSQVNSRIVLDAGGAERLLGKGDLLEDLGH
ncbi:MAG: FtsK/SpoIIIE domain-containing protein, partial [Polyangiaceae bacterium]|nr:FtsK/SpoIIIE domain-containing protein [Polyangiaceae bacterium]